MDIFHLFVPQFFDFLNSVQLCIIPEASCFFSAHLVSLPFVLSVNVVVVALSPGLFSVYFGAFFLMNEG